MAEQEQEHPADQRVRHCYRHPERETGNTCVRCERPICPDCMISAAVGYQCPECVRGVAPGHAGGAGWRRVQRSAGAGAGASRASRPRTIAGGTQAADPRLITKILIGVNVAVFLATKVYGGRLVEELMLFGHATTAPFGPMEGVAEGQWYRLVTSMFLHQQVWHIATNMLGLWFLGGPLEAALGRLRFTALYLLSGLGGGALTYLIAVPAQGSLGASGAIFGLFGAMVVLMRRLNYDMRPILILIAINLVFTFTFPDIAWQAHIGGLVVGGLTALAMVHAPQHRRTLVQFGTCALLLAVVAAVCVLRTYQLTA